GGDPRREAPREDGHLPGGPRPFPLLLSPLRLRGDDRSLPRLLHAVRGPRGRRRPESRHPNREGRPHNRRLQGPELPRGVRDPGAEPEGPGQDSRFGRPPRSARRARVRLSAQYLSTPSARAFRRAIRSWIGGCVLNIRTNAPAANGFTMNRLWDAGLPNVKGLRLFATSSFSSAEARARGCPIVFAPLRSALYSRLREIASWPRIAALGAGIIPTSA